MIKKRRKPVAAALFSFIIPGLGQLYNCQIRKGIIFYTSSVFVEYTLFLSGLLHQFFGLILILVAGLCVRLFIVMDAVFGAKKAKEVKLKPYNKWYVYFFIIITVFFIDISFIRFEFIGFKTYIIQADDMKPTLLYNDFLVVNQNYYKTHVPKRGDIIVFSYPNDPLKHFLKRIVAIENDKVEIKDKQLFLNNQAIIEKYVIQSDGQTFFKENSFQPNIVVRDNYGPVIVPQNHCFVIGDNRDNSFDSRFWGFLPNYHILGKPLYIYWAKQKNRIGIKVN